ILVWKPIPSSNASELMNKVSSTDTWIAIVAHALTGVGIVRSYFQILCGDTYNTKIFVHPHSDKYGLRQLNEDSLFINIYAIALGVTYAIRYINENRCIVNTSSVRQPPVMAIKLSAATVLYDSARWAAIVFGCTYFSFLFFGGIVYRIVASVATFGNFFGIILYAPVIRFSWLDLIMLTRMVLGGTVAMVSWNMGDRVLDVYYATRRVITKDYKNSYECLINGLRDDKHPFIQGTAFAELAEIATKRPTERVALFNDLGTNNNNTAWIQVSRECMKVLDTLCKTIDIEYTGVKPAAAPAPVRKEEVTPLNRIELKDMNVFSKPKTNPVVLDDRTGTLFTHASTHNGTTVISTQPVEAPKHLVFKLLKDAQKQVAQVPWVQEMSKVTAERKIRRIFSNYPILLWSTQSLGSLTAASFNEDPFGLVQRDISKVLDTLIASVMDIERLIRSPPSAYKKLPLGLREAIYQIVTAFRGYTDEIRVSAKYAKKWESFVEFRE
ncbi:nucleoporin protein Ndc1-Nup, partial [Phascolomyces articulosus]